jgi:dihydrofolate reductase
MKSASVKTSVFVGTSLDGFIARVDGAFDFLPPGGGEEHGFDAFFASVDALVMGRHTYDTARSFDSWPYGLKPVFVLSSRTPAGPPDGAVVEHLSGTPAEVLAVLAARGVRHAYVDGGVTVQRFLAAGMINRIVVTRVPVLIGEGRPLFGPTPHDIALRHVATRHFASGLVQSEYEVC